MLVDKVEFSMISLAQALLNIKFTTNPSLNYFLIIILKFIDWFNIYLIISCGEGSMLLLTDFRESEENWKYEQKTTF